MARIFISHSHTDEAIAHKLFDFLIAALKLDDEDILCTSDPNSGLSFNSNTISDQLKSNLKQAKALVALVTTDSLRSPWIPFEIGSFWPTEKTIVLILGPGLTPEKLPGPLKGWLSISIENDQAFAQLNQVINQLEKKLEIRQNVNRSRRDRYLREFITRFKAWESRFSETDGSLEKQVAELSKQLKDQKELEKSLKDRIEQLDKKLVEARSQAAQQIKELEEKHQAQIEKLKEIKPSQNLVQSFPDQDFIEDLRNGIKLEMVAISGGTFMMGSPEDEGKDNEKPQHQVKVQSFFIGKYPITQAQYRQLMGVNPSYFKGREDAERRPVECVSWDKAVEFCQRLSKLSGKEYRLPTEAEWEYAARAGTTTQYYFGENITGNLANYDGKIDETTDVGKYQPNAFGLYDMTGNVWEWCRDDWHNDYQNAPSNGNVWLSGRNSRKVTRGSSWVFNSDRCRSAYRGVYPRDGCDGDIGFRVVCAASRAR